jgi:putative cobalt transporter subunit CbtA
VAQYLLPDVNEVPDQFSAVVLWRFRMASIGIQAVSWATLGIGFGIAAEIRLRSPQARERASNLAFR